MSSTPNTTTKGGQRFVRMSLDEYRASVGLPPRPGATTPIPGAPSPTTLGGEAPPKNPPRRGGVGGGRRRKAGDDLLPSALAADALPKLPWETPCIGVDPGTHTGLALYEPEKAGRIGKADAGIAFARTLPFWQATLWAIRYASARRRAGLALPMLVIEDARSQPMYGVKSGLDHKAAMQAARGVGVTDRDATLWIDLAVALGLPHLPVTPRTAKQDPAMTARICGYTGPALSQHAADALLRVYAMRPESVRYAPPPKARATLVPLLCDTDVEVVDARDFDPTTLL